MPRGPRQGPGVIWLFYEGEGMWGLRINQRYEKAKNVIVLMPMRGVMRPGASPNCYLQGKGVVVRRGETAILTKDGRLP